MNQKDPARHILGATIQGVDFVNTSTGTDIVIHLRGRDPVRISGAYLTTNRMWKATYEDDEEVDSHFLQCTIQYVKKGRKELSHRNSLRSKNKDTKEEEIVLP